MKQKTRYPAACLAFVVIWWIAWGIRPLYRDIWLSESVLIAVAIPLLIYIHRRIGLSNLAYTLTALFLACHIVGSHYSYSDVPLGEWARHALDYKRNHYDRLVHFLFGVLIAVPLREILVRGAKLRAPGPSGWITLAIVMAASTFYELIEWWYLLGADPDAGISFLGAQGDIWDTQKDTALASLGAVLTLGTVYFTEARRAAVETE